jgi:hypothetical protein
MTIRWAVTNHRTDDAVVFDKLVEALAIGAGNERIANDEAPRVLCRLLVSHGGWRPAEEDRSGAEGARGAAGA